MPIGYLHLFIAAYAAIGVCVAAAYVIINHFDVGWSQRGSIVAREPRGKGKPTRLYSRLTFFVKLIVMWPWIIYTLIRPK